MWVNGIRVYKQYRHTPLRGAFGCEGLIIGLHKGANRLDVASRSWPDLQVKCWILSIEGLTLSQMNPRSVDGKALEGCLSHRCPVCGNAQKADRGTTNPLVWVIRPQPTGGARRTEPGLLPVGGRKSHPGR